MTKKELMNDLRIASNGSAFISTNRLRKWLGTRHETVMELVTDLEFLQRGRAKEYFIGDIADEVMRRRERNEVI